MIEFFRSLFGMKSGSGATAKERLRLVLLSDHLSLAPDLVDSLKAELLEVIARYVDIDRGNADITFEHRDREIAMLASVPVTGVRKDPPAARNGNGVHILPLLVPVPDEPPAAGVATPAEALAETVADRPGETVESAAAIDAVALPDKIAAAEPPVENPPADAPEAAQTPVAAVDSAAGEPAGEAAETAAVASRVRTPVKSNQAARPRRRRRRRASAPPADAGLEDVPAAAP